MDSRLVSIAVGSALCLAALTMLRGHWLSWKRTRQDAGLDDADRLHYFRRYRRRMQTSAMLGIIGLCLPLGDPDVVPVWNNVDPRWPAAYWIGVLLVVCWVICLAMADMLATRTHSQIALNRVRRKQRELEDQLAEMRRRGNGNGRASLN